MRRCCRTHSFEYVTDCFTWIAGPLVAGGNRRSEAPVNRRAFTGVLRLDEAFASAATIPLDPSPFDESDGALRVVAGRCVLGATRLACAGTVSTCFDRSPPQAQQQEADISLCSVHAEHCQDSCDGAAGFVVPHALHCNASFVLCSVQTSHAQSPSTPPLSVGALSLASCLRYAALLDVPTCDDAALASFPWARRLRERFRGGGCAVVAASPCCTPPLPARLADRRRLGAGFEVSQTLHERSCSSLKNVQLGQAQPGG